MYLLISNLSFFKTASCMRSCTLFCSWLVLNPVVDTKNWLKYWSNACWKAEAGQRLLMHGVSVRVSVCMHECVWKVCFCMCALQSWGLAFSSTAHAALPHTQSLINWNGSVGTFSATLFSPFPTPHDLPACPHLHGAPRLEQGHLLHVLINWCEWWWLKIEEQK